MKKKIEKTRRRARSENVRTTVFSETVPTLPKLSPQLESILTFGLGDVRRMASAYRTERRRQNAKIEALSTKLAGLRGRKRRAPLKREIGELLESIPNSPVHGVYFPRDDELGPDAPIMMDGPYVSALIKSHCAQVDLETLGIRVRAQAGDVFSAFIPWELLESLAGMPGIDFIELARPYRNALHTALPYSKIKNLQTLGLTGANVIVGVIDSFLCFYHPDFRKADGSTRVLFLWDQALPADTRAGESGPAVIPANYGVEYSQADIDAELTSVGPAYQTVRHQTGIVDPNTQHGTLVCGIAAGNGLADVNQKYIGAAPGADIIFVRDAVSDISFADSTQAMDAFSYIFRQAEILGKPCVVNLSQSDNVGPHDGTSIGEEFLDELLLTPGCAITVAAGNTNNLTEHTSGWVYPADTTAIDLLFASGCEFSEYAEIWYDGHDVFTVTLTIPIEINPPQTVTIGPLAPGMSSPLIPLPNGVSVQLVHRLHDPRNGDNVIALTIADVSNANPIPEGAWTFELGGTTVINGAFHAWVDRNNRGGHGWAPATKISTIAVPASGRRVIAVGSHNRHVPPEIAAASAAGPTRDNRVKPDIAAVGNAGVTAPAYQLINAANPGAAYETDGGTSMAAPMVAGTTALLFECRGQSLTSSDIKQLLQNTAGVPPIGIPSETFGWGFLQAAALCAGPSPVVDVWIRNDAGDTGVEPYIGPTPWLSPDIEVLDLAGNLVSNPTYDPANYINNIVRVTVRNRGTQKARNVEVYLYWSDPATNIPFPAAWRATGIYTGKPDFVFQGNKIVVQQVPAGGSAQVRFGWAPPSPGTNITNDNHFCLIARIEHEDDASNVATGGWAAVQGSNNIAARNTHVIDALGGAANTGFYAIGSGDHDSLELETHALAAQIELVFPVQALPWRELAFINEHGKRSPYGENRGNDPLTDHIRRRGHISLDEVEVRTGIKGLAELRLAGGAVHLIAAEDNHLWIPQIRVEAGAKMPMRLIVRGAKIGDESGFVHVRQRSGGKIIGGVTLELATKLVLGKKMTPRLKPRKPGGRRAAKRARSGGARRGRASAASGEAPRRRKAKRRKRR